MFIGIGLPITRGKGVGFAGYSSIVSSPILPAWVDGWSTDDFGYIHTIPAGAGIPTDAMSQLQLEYTVSGSAAATSLTISAGDQSLGTGNWSGIVLHDDGTYGVHRVSAVGSGVMTIFPPLRKTVTAKTMRNLGGLSNGQHLTEPGYRKLARRIWDTTLKDGYRNKYADKWDSANGVQADWTNIGGLGSGQRNMANLNNYVNNSGLSSAYTFASRGRRLMVATPTTPFSGKGLSRTFNVAGKVGYLELFASAADVGVSGNGFRPFRVQVIADGVTTLLDTTYTAVDSLKRTVVDYTGVSSVVITVTATGDALWTGASGSLLVGDVTFWAYDRSLTWTDRAINKNGKTVVIGDSWTTFYSAVLGAELQSLITADGGSGTVTSVGSAGTTADDGLARFDSDVAPLKPAQVVILYFTNDANALGVNGVATWADNLYRLAWKCQQIGAKPIIVMPEPTSSFSQSLTHATWADYIAPGLSA